MDRPAAYFVMYRSTAHVIIGSGLTVAAAVFCLRFTKMPYSRAWASRPASACWSPLVASLTLTPAVVTVGSALGAFDPKRAMRTRGWRRIGTAIVRWPGAVLVASVAVALIGPLALPGYKTSYDARQYMPDWAPAKVGYAAAERHFSTARLNPEVLMVESDKDLRTPANMIVLEKVAKAVFRTPGGVAMVQSITRPLGTRWTTPRSVSRMSAQSSAQLQSLPFQQARAADLARQVAEISNSITLLQQQYTLQQRATAATDEQAAAFRETVATVRELREKVANFDDFIRPLRNFLLEPHCYDIPVCAAVRLAVRRDRRRRCADRPVRPGDGQPRRAQRGAAPVARPGFPADRHPRGQ